MYLVRVAETILFLESAWSFPPAIPERCTHYLFNDFLSRFLFRVGNVEENRESGYDTNDEDMGTVSVSKRHLLRHQAQSPDRYPYRRQVSRRLLLPYNEAP